MLSVACVQRYGSFRVVEPVESGHKLGFIFPKLGNAWPVRLKKMSSFTSAHVKIAFVRDKIKLASREQRFSTEEINCMEPERLPTNTAVFRIEFVSSCSSWCAD